MIRVTVKRRAEGSELLARGHAGYGARGEDIVCAGVSALLYGQLAYLEGLMESRGLGRVDRAEREGELWMRTRGFEGMDEMALSVTLAGLRLMAEAFSDCVTVCEEQE